MRLTSKEADVDSVRRRDHAEVEQMLHNNLAEDRDVSSSRSMSQVEVTIDCQGENQHVKGERRRPQEDEPVVVFSARDVGRLDISSTSKVGTKLENSAYVFVERQFVKPAASERKSGKTRPRNTFHERKQYSRMDQNQTYQHAS